jgi:hypothetical protein
MFTFVSPAPEGEKNCTCSRCGEAMTYKAHLTHECTPEEVAPGFFVGDRVRCKECEGLVTGMGMDSQFINVVWDYPADESQRIDNGGMLPSSLTNLSRHAGAEEKTCSEHGKYIADDCPECLALEEKVTTLSMGDRVVLSGAGKATWGVDRDQGDGGPGTVDYIEDTAYLPVGVQWDNGVHNGYEPHHLARHGDTLEEKACGGGWTDPTRGTHPMRGVVHEDDNIIKTVCLHCGLIIERGEEEDHEETMLCINARHEPADNALPEFWCPACKWEGNYGQLTAGVYCPMCDGVEAEDDYPARTR